MDSGGAHPRTGRICLRRIHQPRAARSGQQIQLLGGSYTDARIRLSYPLGGHSTLFALVDNLLNRQYAFLPGYPMPGINASGGFTLKF